MRCELRDKLPPPARPIEHLEAHSLQFRRVRLPARQIGGQKRHEPTHLSEKAQQLIHALGARIAIMRGDLMVDDEHPFSPGSLPRDEHLAIDVTVVFSQHLAPFVQEFFLIDDLKFFDSHYIRYSYCF